tara:strand:- start:4106 stop:4774 length:669 start_codon:yes stop_codon:yes gene_type:complete
MKKYIYNRFNFSKKYQNELINFIRNFSNAEMGGKKFYDGTNTHYMQNAYEIVKLIFELKKHEKKKKYKLKSFLEIGYSAGFNNSVLNKFFNFSKIVAVDNVDPAGKNTNTFFSNLRFKSISLICGDSTDLKTISNVKKLGGYDLIFIDGGHSYEIVKKDFYNYKKFLNKNGVIALHDIKSNLPIGVPKFWNELKRDHKNWKINEFFEKDHMIECGIGCLTKN